MENSPWQTFGEKYSYTVCGKKLSLQILERSGTTAQSVLGSSWTAWTSGLRCDNVSIDFMSRSLIENKITSMTDRRY